MFLTFIRLFKRLFFNIAISLILFFLPFDLMFRISSWSLFMPTMDIVKDVSLMTLLLTLGAVFLSFISVSALTLVTFPLGKIFLKLDTTKFALVDIGSLLLILVLLFLFLEKWFLQITGSNIYFGGANPIIVLVIIGFLILWVRKIGLQAAGDLIHSRLTKANGLVLSIILLSFLIVGLNGIELHDFNEIKSNPVSTPSVGMPNVILLSVDTLAAEDMSLYGYHLPTTPKLEAFAKESYVFENYFSSSNWTTPTISTFLSGLYPVTSGVNQQYSYFREDDRKKNLSQALKDIGYHTVAVVANNFAHPLTLRISDSFSETTEPAMPGQTEIGAVFFSMKNYRIRWWLNKLRVRALSEFDFKQFKQITFGGDASTKLPTGDEDGPVNSRFPPETVFDRTIPFFKVLKKPYFVWAHIFPPHEPFTPAPPFKNRFEPPPRKLSKLADSEDFEGDFTAMQQHKVDQLRLRYDEFILDTDFRIGEFLDRLRALGRFDDSIIIITADHGESFTKNFLYHSGPYLHQPLIHIPLMIHLPKQRVQTRISSYASQVDLLPTIMDLLNLPIPKWGEGESLKPAMLEGRQSFAPKFSMNLEKDSSFTPPTKGTFAVMQDGWKLVRYLATGKEELYHLETDPKEDHDLACSNPEQATKMRKLIYSRFKLGK